MRACNSQGACRKSENIFEVIYRQCPRPLAVLKSGRFFGGYARPHNGPLVTLGEPREGVARRGRGRVAARFPLLVSQFQISASQTPKWDLSQ